MRNDKFYKPTDYKGTTGHRCISMEALFKEFGIDYEVCWRSKDFEAVILKREPASSMLDDYEIIYTALYEEGSEKDRFCSYLIDNVNAALFHLEALYEGEPKDVCEDILETINNMFKDDLD